MPEFEPDYLLMNDLLQAAGSIFSAAECHGIMLGMACTGQQHWQQILLEADTQAELPPDRLSEALQQLWDFTLAELKYAAVPLTLLLPDEEAPAPTQARGIRDWCQGFLYGFGLAGEPGAGFFHSEAGEALRDFAEIAQLDVDAVDADDSEDALLQLREYLWVATTLIWQECKHESK